VQGSNNFPEGSQLEFDPSIYATGELVPDPSSEADDAGKVFRYKLKAEKTWLKGEPDFPYTEVKLTRLLDKKGQVLYETKLPGVPIARVYQAPLIKEKATSLYADDKTFKITGSWFNPKATQFRFSPELSEDQYNIDIDPQGNFAVLTLVNGEKWRPSPGPLLVTAVKGVPGWIEYKEKDYVQVAMVKAALVDSDDKAPKVTSPKTLKTIFRAALMSPTLVLKGSGFNKLRPPTIKFKNGPDQDEMQVDVNSPTEIVVRLRKGGKWLADPDMDTLSLIELDGVAVVPSIAVATVVNVPIVRKNRQQLAYLSNTNVIMVEGTGFVQGDTRLKLNPPLVQDVDYEVDVHSATKLDLVLQPGKKWLKPPAQEGPLNIVSIAVGDSEPIVLNPLQPTKGVRVAMIEPDFTGDVGIEPDAVRAYQKQTATIMVNVTSLPEKFVVPEDQDLPVQVELGPAEAVAASDVTAVLRTSDTSAAMLVLTKKDGVPWLSKPQGGLLALSAITLGKKKYNLVETSHANRGTSVARIVPDVSVEHTDPAPIVYRTHTAFIDIKGNGFSYRMSQGAGDEDDLIDADGDDVDGAGDQDVGGGAIVSAAVFDPPLVQDVDYSIWVESPRAIALELLPGRAWRDAPGKLTLVSLDAGAGPVPMNVVLAQVVADDDDLICNDNCEFAKDGRCDDDKPEAGLDEPYCEWGTDCTDCGPRKKSEERQFDALCNNNCGGIYVGDGVCDDGRPGEWQKHCELGSDCDDCGPVPADGFAGLEWCTNGVDGSSNDEKVPGLSCVWPLTVDDKTYDGVTQCVRDGSARGSGWGWCAVSSDDASKWGSCQYCSDVLDQAPLEGDEDDFYSSAGGDGSEQDEGAFVRFVRGLVVLLVTVGLTLGAMRAWKRYTEGRPGEIRYQPVSTADKGA